MMHLAQLASMWNLVIKWLCLQNEDGTKTEYRVWNPFRSKLAAAILGGVDNIWIVSDNQSLFTCSAHGERICLTLGIVVCMGFGYGGFCVQLSDCVWEFGRNLELMCCTLEPHREQPCLTYQIL